MPYEQQVGEDLSDGGFLKMPGWYHLIIVQLDDPATNKDGTIIDWAAFRVGCEVLGGTVSGQNGKGINLTFAAPKPGDRDGGAFRRKIIDRFALAVGLITEADKGKPYRIDPAIVSRQFVVHLDFPTDQNDQPKKFMDIVGGELYHVDDPGVASLASTAMDQRSIGLIAPSLRRAKKAKDVAATNGNGNGSTVTPTTAKPAGYDPGQL